MTDSRRPPDTERRQHARIAVNTRARVLARHNAPVELAIDSVSVGGARLFGEITVALGERVEILFEVEGRPIEVVGEVVRTESVDLATDRIAVRFVELSEIAKERIRKLVDSVLDLEIDGDGRVQLAAMAG